MYMYFCLSALKHAQQVIFTIKAIDNDLGFGHHYASPLRKVMLPDLHTQKVAIIGHGNSQKKHNETGAMKLTPDTLNS